MSADFGPPSSAREPLSAATLVVAAGRAGTQPGCASQPGHRAEPTYHADGPLGYGRHGNPTWEALEQAVGTLEGGRTIAFASGMAAVSAVLDDVAAGGVVVAPEGRTQARWRSCIG